MHRAAPSCNRPRAKPVCGQLKLPVSMPLRCARAACCFCSARAGIGALNSGATWRPRRSPSACDRWSWGSKWWATLPGSARARARSTWWPAATAMVSTVPPHGRGVSGPAGGCRRPRRRSLDHPDGMPLAAGRGGPQVFQAHQQQGRPCLHRLALPMARLRGPQPHPRSKSTAGSEGCRGGRAAERQ